MPSSAPKGLGEDLLGKAETYLVEQAADLGPRELTNLGRGVLQHLAPDIADEGEYQALLAAEDRASAATRLTMRRRGDGPPTAPSGFPMRWPAGCAPTCTPSRPRAVAT